ncbi:arylesterase [Flagellimonas aequoris]|uniref:Arylesterase n=1 Tax=Flagellimonas aequoris TaxID=2306997 RepID=A0A418N326_9FLAO|nr:arylesterase [Allomuricauda aequoris]RIV67696.1 arylesterase [Allomuricauda aequoris]TXJ99478.1 arylesterase [Allomuricauda aequoris]
MTKIPSSNPLPLMFCYFLMLICIACGENASKKTEETTTDDTNQKIETTSSSSKILFFGDSLTAGYGLEVSQAFPALVQQKLDSLGLQYSVVNAGLSGETTASGKNRLNWVLEEGIDIVVLELGANDGLRGIPLTETRSNLQSMIQMIRNRLPEAKIILAGMKIPPNMGPEYTSEFESIFPELATQENVALIPFLLEDVAGIPGLNQEDGIHPTLQGQKIVANNVWDVLAPLL